LAAGLIEPFNLRRAALFVHRQQIIAHNDGRLVDSGSNPVERVIPTQVGIAFIEVAGANLFEGTESIAPGHDHQEQKAPEPG
jgi:hypothetical protein